MSSEADNRVATEIRELAERGRYHGKAAALVEMFGVPFTPDGIEAVQSALDAQGLATRPPLRPEEPDQEVTVLIIAGPITPDPVLLDNGDVLIHVIDDAAEHRVRMVRIGPDDMDYRLWLVRAQRAATGPGAIGRNAIQSAVSGGVLKAILLVVVILIALAVLMPAVHL